MNYLGDNMPTFALNFSRPGAQIVAQYYNFLRLGFDGYRQVHGYAREVATRLSAQIADLGPFELITRGDELAVFAFTLRPDVENFTVFDVSNALRERGWQVPAYTFPENRADLAALRVVIRRGFTHDLADLLVKDLKRQLPRLQKQPAPIHDRTTDNELPPLGVCVGGSDRSVKDTPRRRRAGRVSRAGRPGRSSPMSRSAGPTAGPANGRRGFTASTRR